MIIIEKIKKMIRPKPSFKREPNHVTYQRSYRELTGEIRAEVNRIKRE